MFLFCFYFFIFLVEVTDSWDALEGKAGRRPSGREIYPGPGPLRKAS